ncbi:MAG: hypothetical protein QW680_08400 [Pyrobaculum sp.]|uniref:hypothetical protein n=1 Tax=Pyrobaculum arsenaticum TaxID=121277 RepID=UPI002272DDC4|nr:hypothetical protein [Pyrobaculum arsenaticum]
MTVKIQVYKKVVKCNKDKTKCIYRYIIQLPAEVQTRQKRLDHVYLISVEPLLISEKPDTRDVAKPKCDPDAVKLLEEKIQSKSFQKAVGTNVVRAIESLLAICR